MLHVVELITEIKKLESDFLIDKIHPREYPLNRSKIIFGVLEIANAYAYPFEKSDFKKI